MAITAFVTNQGDKFNPKDNSNKPLIVRLNAVKEGVKTKFTEKATKLKRDADNKPVLDAAGDKVYEADMDVRSNGATAIYVDVVDLTTGKVYSNVQWMSNTVVDRLKESPIGHISAMRLDNSKGYIVPVPGTQADVDAANEYEVKVGGEHNLFKKGGSPALIPAPRSAPAEDVDDLA